MSYLQFTFNITNQEASDILIARLTEFGFEGFQEESTVLYAYIKKDHYHPDSFKDFFDSLSIQYQQNELPDTNWNIEWESNFHPIEVQYHHQDTVFVNLRADFHPAHSSAAYDIVINPKMSFGTGHHATTYLMIEKMAELELRDNIVIDFGTGTGVLAILAEKLGAKKVLAIDNDEWSIENATQNIQRNKCSKIIIQQNDHCDCKEEKPSVIFANINLNVIKDNILSIKNSLISKGIVLFSGILKEDFEEMNQLLSAHSFNIIEHREKSSWILIVAVNDSLLMSKY